jgi:hypothetical protein
MELRMPNDVKQKFTIEVDGEGKLVSYTNKLKETEDAGKKVEKSNKGLTESFLKMGASIATVAVAIKSAKIAFSLGELGASVLTVDKNFEQFARKGGMSAIRMMGDLRKASGGLMDDMFLQQQAMKGMISGLKFDDMIVAMEFVRKFALATGDDVNAKMTTVMTGLARGSAQFLDDVGIQVIGSKDVVNDAIAQMKEKMGDFADTSNDTSTAIAGMKTEFENLKQYIGVTLVPATRTWVKLLTEGMQNAKHLIKGLRIQQLEAIGEETKARETNILAYKALYLQTFKDLAKVEARAPSNKRTLDLQKLKKVEKQRLAILLAERKIAQDLQADYKKLNDEIYGTVAPSSITGEDGSNNGQTDEQIANAERLAKAQQKNADGIFGRLKHERAMLKANALTWEGYAKAVATSLTGSLGQDFSNPLGFQKGEQETALEEQKSFMSRYAVVVQAGMNSINSIFNSAHNSRQDLLDKERSDDIKAVNDSTMSAKNRSKEIKKIEEQASKDSLALKLKEWRTSIFMSIGNTALGVTAALATQNYAGAIATGILGDVATGVILANKPKYYYGSRDAGGAYAEIGGNSQGDQINANVRSGELIVQAGKDAQIAKNALNGVTNNSNQQSFSVSPVINISGNADESVLRQIPAMIVDTIQNASFNGLFNPAVA